MSRYVCPICGGDEIREFEIGGEIEREIMFIREGGKVRQVRTMNYWGGAGGKRWWACAGCKNKIPVRTETELFKWVEKHTAS
jgi:hypothetical protein